MGQMEGVQGLSRWAIELTLNSNDNQGLRIQQGGSIAARPGWSLFGIEIADADLL